MKPTLTDRLSTPETHRLLVAVWIVALIVLMWGSLAQHPAMHKMPSSDKLVHLIAYLGMGLLTFAAFPTRSPGLLLGFLLVFGVAIEGAQGLTAGREASVIDALANLMGLAIAFLFWRVVRYLPVNSSKS